MLDEYLREFKYMADCAKLKFKVSLQSRSDELDCIDLKWSGFNDSIPAFAEETLTRIKQF